MLGAATGQALGKALDRMAETGGQALRSIQQTAANVLYEQREIWAEKRLAKQEAAEFRREVDRIMKTMPPTIERWQVAESLRAERERLNPPIYEDEDGIFQHGHPPQGAARRRTGRTDAKAYAQQGKPVNTQKSVPVLTITIAGGEGEKVRQEVPRTRSKEVSRKSRSDLGPGF
jgi:hypothetical protein